MTKQNFPPHYSEDDIENVNRIENWLKENGIAKAQLARQARISGAAVTQILAGSYISSPTNQLTKLISAIQNVDTSDKSIDQLVETSVYQVARSCCQMARQYKNFAVFSGFVGTGKTFSLRHYAKTHPNTHMIEATPTMTSSSLLKRLDVMITGYETKGSLYDKETAVINALKGTDSLLIIDEAETLTSKQLHTVRRIRDIAGIGVVLSGTEHLSGILRPHSQFDQIRSRAGFWPQTITGITEKDTQDLVLFHLGEDVDPEVAPRIHKYCKGSARMVVEGFVSAIRSFRKDADLDVRLVDSIAQQALSLQSLA